MLTRVRIPDAARRARQYPHQLSGGMRQRIALARALLTDAPYLVLDEPTAHLDPATRDALLDDLLAAASGRSLLVITHDRARLDRFDSVVEITRYASPADAPSPAECVVATGVSV